MGRNPRHAAISALWLSGDHDPVPGAVRPQLDKQTGARLQRVSQEACDAGVLKPIGQLGVVDAHHVAH